MAVTVIISRHSGGSASIQDVYDEGAKIDVTADGHLVVKASTGSYLGIYAPGKWGSVYKDDSAQVRA